MEERQQQALQRRRRTRSVSERRHLAGRGSSNERCRSSRAIWEGNLKTVQTHNLQADLGVHTYWLGMNKYADLVRKAFAA